MSRASLAQVASVPAPATHPVIAAASIPGATQNMLRITSGAETIHIIVGHSIFLNTKARLHRIYVADPAVLNSDTISPTQLLVTAMAPGVSSLVLLDEAGQAHSYVVSADLDVEGLRVAMGEAMRSDAVTVEGTGNRVVLSGNVNSEALAETAVKLASLYTKDVANALTVLPNHPKQVRLKVRILEVDRSKMLQMGINLFNPGGNTSFLASTTTSQFPSTATLSQAGAGVAGILTTSNPLNFLLYSSKLNLGATVQDLENKQVLQILAEPTITTISGEKASFLSGGEFPFPMIQPGSGGSGVSVTVSFRPYGVKLEFTPVVNEDGTIRLKVAPEVSALDYSNAVTISGYTIPALSTRRADTEVELRSNQSFAISGLLDQRTTDLLSKTPGISSIPIIGALFKSKNVNHSATELVVIVTPTLVDPLTETTDPVEPDIPIPTLNPETFDKSLGKNRNLQPAAPPINPAQPILGNPAPPARQLSAPSIAPTAGTAYDAAPSQALQTAPAPSLLSPAIAAEATKTPAVAHATALSVKSAQVTDTPAHPMIEIMALSQKSYAEAMAAALKRHGYNVAVNLHPHDSLLHLEMGPFASKTDAEAMHQRLLLDGYSSTVR